MLDSTWGYDYPQALRVGRAIQEMGFYWYEDPLTEWDIYNYQKLKQQLHIPIMATEYPIAGLDTYVAWLTAKATDKSEEHTSELQSLMRNSYAVFCLKKKT